MPTVTELLSPKTALSYLNRFFEIAVSKALDITTWRTGDPTNVIAEFQSEALGENLDPLVVSTAKSAFIEEAEEDYAEIHAEQIYGVTRGEETYATPTVTLTNTGGGVYPVGPGEVTVKCSATNVTFHSTGIISGPGSTSFGSVHVLQLVADTPGSAGSVGANDIDELVTTMLGVVVTSSTAAVGQDKQSLESLRQDCRDSRGALSPNGPPDAYEYVVRQTKYTGLASGVITRSRSTKSSGFGECTIYICDADGDTAGGAAAAALLAAQLWANPLTGTPAVSAATKVVVNVTADVESDTLPADFEAVAAAALATMFSEFPIAGDAGLTLFRDSIRGKIRSALGLPDTANVVLVEPAADVVLALGEVPALGTVSVDEV